MEPFNTPKPDKPQRTFLLWFLAICTMVNAGMNVISFTMYACFPDFVKQSLETVKNISLFSGEEYQEAMSIFLSVAPRQYILLIVAELATFIGALIMLWKLRSIGFHIYTIGQILEFCTLNFIIGGKLAMPFSAVLMTVLIIVMYATQLRYMKDRFEDKETEKNIEQTDQNE